MNIEGQNTASRQIQDVRSRIAELNTQIARNNREALTANETRRAAIQETNRQLRAEQGLLRAQRERSSINLANLRMEATAARQAARAAEESRQATQQLTAGLAIGAGLAARELGQLTAGFVQSAANMETFRASLNSVTGDADETNRVLQQLLGLTVELVGIDTGDLISYAARLMATGLSAEQSISAIRGVTERVAEQGKSAEVTNRVLEQLTQAINSNTISAQDFRPILRELPTLFQDASNAMGQPIRSLEDFRNAADAVGGPTQAIILLVEEMARASEGADLNTLNAQLDILQDQARILAAELGEHLIPAIVAIVRQINEWIQAFNEMDDDVQAAIAWAAALATGIAGLTAVVGGAVVAFGAFSASLAAITGATGLAGLGGLATQAAGGLGRLVPILGRIGSAGNLATTAVITLTQAWQMIYDAFQRTPPFEDAQESITAFNIAASQTAQGLNLTAESLSGLSESARTEIELLVERADQLRSSIRSAINRGDTEGAAAFREEYRRVTAQIESLTMTLPPAREGINAATTAINALATSLPPAVRFTRELGESTITAEQAFAMLTPTVEQITIAMRAAGVVAEILDDSMTDLENTLLTGQDPLRDYAASLGLTSEAADRAIGTVNQVGEAVRDADFRQAESELRDFDSAFQLSEATIPRVTSAMREFTGTAPDVDRVTTAVESSTRSVDDLLDSIDAVPDGVTTATDMATDAFTGFNDEAVRAVDNIVRSFDPLFDVLGDVGGELSNFTTLITSLATGNVLGIISSTANIILPGLTDPQRVLDFTQPVAGPLDPQQIQERFGLTPVQLQQLDFSGVAPGLLEILAGVTDPGAAAASSTRFNLLQRITAGRPSFGAELAAPVDAQEAGIVADVFADVPQAVSDVVMEAIPELSDVFRFTGEQRSILEPLENNVAAAQMFIDDFITEDSTPEEIQEAYTNLANAEQALYNQQVAFINNATGITEDARGRALMVAGQIFDREIREANLDLVDALADIGFQLVETLTFTSGILSGTSLAVQRIPQMVEEVSVPEPEAPPELRQSFSFTGEQQLQLDPLRDEIREARQAISLLTDESTPEEITAAYTRLGNAEQAYLDRQLEFINAGVGIFTDTALAAARNTALERFDTNIFNANNRLVGNLRRVGFQLVTMFDQSSGFLEGVELAIEAIPIPEMPEMPDAPRDVFRFSGAQRDTLATLQGEADEAEETLRQLERDDTATPEQITAAYTAFTNAQQAVLDQELEFIGEATNITDAARENAETQARQRFRSEIFDANETLFDGLENLGFTLTNTIMDWFSVLMGTALDIQAIPPPEVPETPEEAPTPVSPATFAQNRLNRARFGIRTATTEQGFDDAVQEAIAATNAYYDAELTRIEGLGLAEDELADKREDLSLARRMDLFRYQNIENPFRQERLQGIEDEAEAQESANQMRIRQEMRLQDTLNDLREDAFETEAERQQRLIDLEQDTQDRILGIQRNAMRSREDLQREFGRDIEDILRGAGVDDAFFRSGDFQDIQRLAQLPNQDFLRERLSGLGISLGDDDFSRIGELARQRTRDQEDIGFREADRREDAQIRATERANAITEASNQALFGTNLAIDATTAELNALTAPIASETAATESTNAITNAENAMMDAANATAMGIAGGTLTTAGETLITATESFGDLPERITSAITTGFHGVFDPFLMRFEGFTTRLENLSFLQPTEPFNFSGAGGRAALGAGNNQPVPVTIQGGQVGVNNFDEMPDTQVNVEFDDDE